MAPLKPARKATFAFVWGVLGWGGTTALILTLMDWHTDGHLKPVHVVGRFVLFMSVGYFLGLRLWDRFGALGHMTRTRAQVVVRFVLFVGLMLGLIYLLWILSRP